MLDREDATIIIPHLGANEDQKRSLKECLISLNETVPDVRKIVAFNGSPEHLGKNFLSQPDDEYDFVIVGDQGQCKAVNAAAAIVTTPWILVTNDDMMYAEGWYGRLLDAVLETKSLCMSPQLVEPRPGAPTFVTKFFGGAGGDFNKKAWNDFAEDFMENGEGEVRPGFNLPFLIRKDLWDLVGGYDIKYDPWSSNSDSDLEYKIKLAGVQPMQTTKSIVYHFSQTSGTFEPQNGGAWGKNWQYFIDKWGFPRTDDGIWEATFKIPTVKEGRKFRPTWEGVYAN